jgi:hypothetical protein
VELGSRPSFAAYLVCSLDFGLYVPHFSSLEVLNLPLPGAASKKLLESREQQAVHTVQSTRSPHPSQSPTQAQLVEEARKGPALPSATWPVGEAIALKQVTDHVSG